MSFFRKHVRGLLRQTFSNTKSSDEEEFLDQYDSNGRPMDYGASSLVYERILNGRNGRKVQEPEIYSGKTGVDLPLIHLDKLFHPVRAAFSGPAGGLTNVSIIYFKCFKCLECFKCFKYCLLVQFSGSTNTPAANCQNSQHWWRTFFVYWKWRRVWGTRWTWKVFSKEYFTEWILGVSWPVQRGPPPMFANYRSTRLGRCR